MTEVSQAKRSGVLRVRQVYSQFDLTRRNNRDIIKDDFSSVILRDVVKLVICNVLFGNAVGGCM